MKKFRVNDVLTCMFPVRKSQADDDFGIVVSADESDEKSHGVFLLLCVEKSVAANGFYRYHPNKYYFLFDEQVCFRYDLTHFRLLSRIEE